MTATIGTALTLDTLAGRIHEAHTDAQRAFAHALDRALAAGELLIEAKAQLDHGAWLPWLQDACAVPERTAQAYMRLARNRPALEEQTRNGVADFGVRGALAFLTEPTSLPEPRGPYQIMPRMTPDEYHALKASIAASGVLVPIMLDETGAILDGHERVRACRELGITDYPRLIQSGLTEDAKISLHIGLNLARQHLTPDQRAAILVVAEELEAQEAAHTARAAGGAA